MILRDAVQGHYLAQLFSALFFVASLILACILLIYWLYAAACVLNTPDEQADAQELVPLHWDRRLWELFLHIVLPARWLVQ